MEETDVPTINDEIARKFRKIEADLSTRRSAAELFEALLAGIEREFAIPFVWLSLIRLPETAGLRKSLEASAFLQRPPELNRQDALSGDRPRLRGPASRQR